MEGDLAFGWEHPSVFISGSSFGLASFFRKESLCPEGLNVVLAFESKKGRGQEGLSIQPAMFSFILLVLDAPHFVSTCA